MKLSYCRHYLLRFEQRLTCLLYYSLSTLAIVIDRVARSLQHVPKRFKNYFQQTKLIFDVRPLSTPGNYIFSSIPNIQP